MNNKKHQPSHHNRGQLLTEKDNTRTQNLDLFSTDELVNIFSEEDILPQQAVYQAKPEIAKAIKSIYPKLQNGGRLFYLGAGTSGRLGVLDASECPPTFCTPPELVQGIIAGGDPALKKSSEGLEDLDYLALDDLKARSFSSKDCLIGITAGGTTPYVLSSLNYAREIGALSIAISNVPIEQANIICDINIRLLTGPELLTGSTRLKAGTATKMTLNMISTIVMVKLGKVYGNKMVDVAVTNKKLLDRAVRIIVAITDIDSYRAIELLNESNGSVKISILMALAKLDSKEAKKILDHSDQNLRKALAQYK